MRGFIYDAGSRLPIAAPPDKPPIAPVETCDAYVELAARSNFSFLRGGSSPEALVRRAAELGYESIALTDYAGLYGTVRAMLECEELGARVRPVGGSAAGVTPRTRTIVGCEIPLSAGADGVLLHVQNHAGYTHLCELLSEAHRNGPKLTKSETAFAPAESVARAADGLWCTAAASMGRAAIATLKDAFGSRLSLGVFRHLDGEDARRERETIAMASELGVAIVAHNAVRFAIAEHKPVLDVLHCIRRGVTLDEAGRELLPNAEARLVSPREMVSRFSDHPDWIARTREIAGACTFSLRELAYKFPCEVPEGETADTLLRKTTYEGARDRYGEIPAKVRALIEKELALIAKLEVATYFLSVRAIVDIARERDILCQGRGSAANSAVCYCLGITAVDPARSSLLFERFLSAERKEPPDIDVDFEHERREEVIQEIYRRYGRGRAAMVSEVICYRGKSALREVGKVFGFSLEQVDRLSSVVTWWDKLVDEGATRPRTTSSLTQEGGFAPLSPPIIPRLRDSGFDPNDARVRHCLAMAGAIQGYPRHLSIHVGGFVLSAEPLERIAPVEPATMKDRTVVPWDKDDIDALGFFKVDVLGLGMLTAIRKALLFVKGATRPLGGSPAAHPATGGSAPPVPPVFVNDLLAAIPPEDPAVYDALGRADSVGVFQIESRAQMAMLPRLRPKCFYDLVIEVAIVRPGPIQGGMVHPYLRRRNGEEAIDVPHEILRPILERTLGVPLFQEQVMQIAIVGAGYSGGEADQLRRDMAAWKRNGKLARHRDRLQRGFSERGISEEFGERLYKQIQGFGEYGFPESHAASFALLVYASSWLKVHHPAAFAAALVNSQPMGFYSPSTIFEDAKRHGVGLLPIRVNCSNWDCSLVLKGATRPLASFARSPLGDSPPAHPATGGFAPPVPPMGAIQLGLRLVRGLGEESGKRIEKNRPYASVEDLRARAELDQGEMDALAEAGALNDIVEEALWGGKGGRSSPHGAVAPEGDEQSPSLTRNAMWSVRAARGEGLFRGMGVAENVSLPPLSRTDQLVLDFERTGVSIADHPMLAMRPALPENVLGSLALAKTPHGARVTTAGLVICRQRPGTASGVVFMTLEDELGFVNLVLWAKTFERYRRVATASGIVLARGKIDSASGVVHVIVEHIEKLKLDRDLPHLSRDFH